MLRGAAEALLQIAAMASPAVPGAAREIAERLGTTIPDDLTSFRWGLLPAKAQVAKRDPLFARVDRMDNPCLDCAGIDYLPIAINGPFTLTIAGFEYYIHPSVRFSPNVEYVAYSNPTTGTRAKNDLVARLTFYWVW